MELVPGTHRAGAALKFEAASHLAKCNTLHWVAVGWGPQQETTASQEPEQSKCSIRPSNDPIEGQCGPGTEGSFCS